MILSLPVPPACLLPALLLLWVGMLACFGIHGTDIWWHLAAGRHLVTTGDLYGADVFSYLSSAAPQIKEYWLFDALLYGVWKVTGETGIVLFKVTITVGVFLVLVAGLLRRGVPPATITLCSLAPAVALSPRMWERPELATWLAVAVFLTVLPRGIRPPRWRVIGTLAGVELVWVNCHSAFFLGPMLCALWALGQWINLTWVRPLPSRGERARLLSRHVALLALVSGVTLLNPWGWNLHRSVAGLLSSDTYSQIVLEWQSPLRSANAFIRWGWIPLTAVPLAGLCLGWRRRDAVLWLWWMALTAFSLQAVRLTSIAALISAPVAAEAWAAVTAPPAQQPERQRRWLMRLLTGVLLGLCFSVFSGWHWYLLGQGRRFGLHAPPWRYPREEAAFIAAHDLQGNGFNDYVTGSYLQWALGPQRRIGIDGRAGSLYGAETLQEALAVQWGQGDWRGHFEERDIHWAIVDTGLRELIRLLWGAPDWHLVFAGPRALVFVDESPGHRRIIDELGVEGRREEEFAAVPASSPHPWWRAPDVAFVPITRAAILSKVGRPDLALQLIEAELRVRPRSAELTARRAEYARQWDTMLRALADRGVTALTERRLDEAEEMFSRLTRVVPQSAEGWGNLSVVYAITHRYASAEQAAMRALEIDPGSEYYRANLARLRSEWTSAETAPAP